MSRRVCTCEGMDQGKSHREGRSQAWHTGLGSVVSIANRKVGFRGELGGDPKACQVSGRSLQAEPFF